MPRERETRMKVGIIGVGNVGTACAKAMLLRGSCLEIVLLDTDEARANGVAADLSHGESLCPPTKILAGGYRDLTRAAVVVITAGINERTGKAIDRDDNLGRLRLLPHNAAIYSKIVPRIARVAPRALILVVTDPPDPLADVARRFTKSPVLSSGTFLDTLRFRLQLATELGCHPSSVDALVVGEHGTSQVYVWSSATIGGEPVLELARRKGLNVASFRAKVEQEVKYANIKIIEGTGASQHGIGIVTARIVEAILRDEGLVAPIGVLQPEYGVTLSLPAVIGRGGVSKVLAPALSGKERRALAASAKAIAGALDGLADELRP
ncbi:MAG TPA: lactate dehydrogenase [Thermoanaerobaculia bacterium]|nr:lactate dehydrogenase [Thermoanaerobaculia bacterium]